MRFQDWPSLRLVVPLIAGIIISDTILNTRAEVPVWCVLAFVPILVLLTVLYSGRQPRLSGVCLSLCFFFAGAFSYLLQMRKVRVEWPSRWVVYHGVVNTYPAERERTYRYEVTLTDSLYSDRRIYLYLPKDSLSSSLEPGQIIVFDGKINKPSSEGAGFDYASYLLSHGISGTLRVQAKDWRAVQSQGRLSLRTRCARFRRSIMGKYKEWGLDGNALAVASAVTLGEKKALSDDLKEVYSTSGVSHVLAVSGLHVGIMCWFLYLLLPSFLFGRARWLRELIVMGILWTYALAIGLPVSITRSLIMFSVVAVCRALNRESSALNSLGIAALFMIVANPSAIFDMSFQLSFSAVLFIVLFTPLILDLYAPRTFIGRYFWRVTALSLAAQIGTAPLIMYHFSSFSTYVLAANLFVVPVMFLVVALSMSLWITGWFPALRGVTADAITWLVDVLTSVLTRITELPYSNLELSIGQGQTLAAVYAVILLVYMWIKDACSRHLVSALMCIAAACIMGLFQNFVV